MTESKRKLYFSLHACYYKTLSTVAQLVHQKNWRSQRSRSGQIGDAGGPQRQRRHCLPRARHRQTHRRPTVDSQRLGPGELPHQRQLLRCSQIG